MNEEIRSANVWTLVFVIGTMILFFLTLFTRSFYALLGTLAYAWLSILFNTDLSGLKIRKQVRDLNGNRKK